MFLISSLLVTPSFQAVCQQFGLRELPTSSIGDEDEQGLQLWLSGLGKNIFEGFAIHKGRVIHGEYPSSQTGLRDLVSGGGRCFRCLVCRRVFEQ